MRGVNPAAPARSKGGRLMGGNRRQMVKPEFGAFIDDGQRQQGEDDNHKGRLGQHAAEGFGGEKGNQQALHFGGSIR